MDAQNHFLPIFMHAIIFNGMWYQGGLNFKNKLYRRLVRSLFLSLQYCLTAYGCVESNSTIMITCAFGFFVRMMGASFLPMLAYWVPGLCAALYWQIPSRLSHWFTAFMHDLIRIPSKGISGAICVLLVHSSNNCIQNIKCVWHDALASTFIAHAVGSVIWLYTVPMTAAAWIALIPLVACERMLYASGIVIGHTMIASFVSMREYSRKSNRNHA